MKTPALHTAQHRGDCKEAAVNTQRPENESFISATFQRWAISLLLAYFGARLLFFALNITSFVPPDEITHAGISKIFSKTFLLPTNSPETWQFGLVTNITWLYYWTMGKLLHLNFLGLPDLVFLRLLNIPLAFGTAWFAVRLLRLLTNDRLTLLLLVVVMTNTPMFSFLSASVSYDNLVNLLAAMAIYYLFAFFRNRSGGLLVATLLCQMAGSLTKVTFLPLILALGILLIIHEVKHLTALPATIRHLFRTSPSRAGLATLVLLVGLGLNLQLYAGNYFRYGTLNPSMEKVLSTSAAMEHRLDARGKIFNDYKEGKITYMEALILAGEIRHEGDKADTFYLLMNYENLKHNPLLWLGPFDYAKKWFWYMVNSIFGIRAHLQMYKGNAWMIPVYLLLGLSVLGFIIRWQPQKGGWIPPSLMAVALFYAGFIMYHFNYDSYLVYGEPSLSVYGRYLFPVLAPVSVLFCHYLLQLFRNSYLRKGLALATVLLFIGYDFPWFLLHATSEWYQWMPK